MPPDAAPEPDANVVEQVRSQVLDLLHPRYDTHFNILRWLQSCEYNVPKTVHNLRKHLRWRRERHLDEDGRGLQSCAVTAEYAPVSIIGPNRKDGDRLIVVDQSGRIDIGGVMKSIQPTQYLHQLFRNFEKMLTILNEMEAKNGVFNWLCILHLLDALKICTFRSLASRNPQRSAISPFIPERCPYSE
ncbi:hypothetical protein COOONC_18303 [Cooperia oncophora]